MRKYMSNWLNTQEEFIWAIRQRRHGIDDYDDKKSKKTDTVDYQKKAEEEQSQILASLVPDEILHNVKDYSHKDYNVCLLFGDVSGFTELCEKYNAIGKGGPSKLTIVLNGYIGAMVQEVMSYGGDVLKFSGDAFLAMWKGNSNMTMRDLVHEAIDCALVIQKTYGTYNTDVGVLLRVKLAIGAGPVVFSLIGDEIISHYVVVGQPILDVKEAEHKSTAGEIICSPSAWYHVNAIEYLYQELDDALHVKILGVGPNWRHINKQDTRFKDKETESSGSSTGTSSSCVLECQTNLIADFSIRPTLNRANLNKEALRKFIIPPVMKGIDLHQPMDFLTEMRQVVISFVNIVPKKVDNHDMVVIVDNAYKIICKNVIEYKGCVNKVSLFDKDIMIVLIFGLRGFKNDLECQRALKCAAKNYEEIEKVPGVRSVSIACTTGKTYCGVVGHTLRREYTVISLTVNKAARLMVNYPDKVTCDRQTFQNSKMESVNFVKLEYRPLKGITNPGPVYQFKPFKTVVRTVLKINPYPILGREREIKIYTDLRTKSLTAFDVSYKKEVNKNQSNSTKKNCKILLIEGNPRQGKTRLLEEFIYKTDDETPINSFNLANGDQFKPYNTIKLIFREPLDLNDDLSDAERQEKLARRLKNVNCPDFNCALNPVFNVNFPTSKAFDEFSNDEKVKILNKMIKQLSFSCFLKQWIVAIDNANFIDPESWKVIIVFLDLSVVFIVMTYCPLVYIAEEAKEIFDHKAAKKIFLKNIRKIYHAGVTCQLLNVYAIPAELENVIQSKSGGNPGWIDSFLTTLMQGRNLVIRNIDYRKMHTTGLVAPPLYMMHRLSEEDANLWKCIMEEKSYDYSIMKGFRDDWHFFIDCCRDSFTNVTIRQQIDSALMKDVFLPVCFLEKNFNAADIDAEASVDTTILTTFDSLNYDEQLLLKCSSVLGDSFPRAMLAYILGNPNPRHMALAVRTLFEIKVLCCGQGDFMDGANYVVIRNKMEDPLKRLNMNCGCEGLNVTDDCYDLPKYANCGYLRFRSSYFRETTYNLLTVAQQKEFHTKAAKYLMTETRKCRGCGSTFFNFKLLSGVDEGLMKKRKTRKERRRGKSLDRAFFTEFDEQIGSPQGQSVSSGRQSVSVATAALYMKRRSTVVLQPYAPTDPEDEEETSFVLPVRNGLRTINHLKDSYSLTKTYSHLDLSQCECNRILNSLYSMLVNHYTGSSQWRLLLGALISYARFCIATNNIAKAIILVNQGIKFLQTSGKDTGLPNWAIPIEEAKCYTLFGICLYHLGQHDDAFNKFKIAIAKYGYPFPGTKVGSILKLTSKRLRQKFGMYLAPDGFRKEIDSETHISNNNVSECLVWLSKLYMIKGKTKLAELAAIWSLNVCLETQSNISRICEAFSNMILFCCQNNKLHYTIALEVHSLRYLHKKRGEPNSEEAFSIATLYSTIFVARKHRNELDKALHIGYIYVRMNIALKNFESATSLMPTLINILVEKLYLTEAISLVNELQFYVTETYESTGRARFYCAAMQFHLETGYSVVSFSECLQFYQTQGLDMSLLKDSCLKLQYIVCMWLWHLRNEKWEEASAWTDIIESDTVTFILMLNKIMFRVSNIIYQMEGILHLLNNNINTLNNDGIQKMKKKFLAILPLGYKALYYSPFWTGRYYHLKAYYYHLLNNESKARHYLDYAVKISNKMGLALETQFLEHTDKAWSEELPKNIKNLWKTRCNPDNLLDVNDMTANTKLAFYTYTTPMYL